LIFKNQFKIKEVDFRDTLSLRCKVLKPHLTEQECINPGDLRSGSFHFAAFSINSSFDAEPLGIASFEIENHPQLKANLAYRLRGMATDESARNVGLGRQLVLLGETKIRSQNGDLLWFNAREIAFPFYQSLGFQSWGEIFDISPIGPHKVMYKYL